MSEREELEAVIGRAVQSTHGTPADIATALINSGYTKGNGELVEAVRALIDAADTFASMRVCWSAALREAGEPISSMKEIAINYSAVFEINAAVEAARKALSDSEEVVQERVNAGLTIGDSHE